MATVTTAFMKSHFLLFSHDTILYLLCSLLSDYLFVYTLIQLKIWNCWYSSEFCHRTSSVLISHTLSYDNNNHPWAWCYFDDLQSSWCPYSVWYHGGQRFRNAKVLSCQFPFFPFSIMLWESFWQRTRAKKGERRYHFVIKDVRYPSVKSSVKLGNSGLFRFLPPPFPKTLILTFVSYYALAGCLGKKFNLKISLLSVCSQPIFNSVARQCVHLNLKSDHVCLLFRSLQGFLLT